MTGPELVSRPPSLPPLLQSEEPWCTWCLPLFTNGFLLLRWPTLTCPRSLSKGNVGWGLPEEWDLVLRINKSSRNWKYTKRFIRDTSFQSPLKFRSSLDCGTNEIQKVKRVLFSLPPRRPHQTKLEKVDEVFSGLNSGRLRRWLQRKEMWSDVPDKVKTWVR